MIARHWRGWTAVQNADAYERLLKQKVLPGLKQVEGYRGGYVLRHDGPQEVEFVVLNLFDSLEAVKGFAGPDYTIAVFEPEARSLLSRIEPVARTNAQKSEEDGASLAAPDDAGLDRGRLRGGWAQMEPELPKYFGLLPKQKLEVKPVEEFREKDAASAQYFEDRAPWDARYKKQGVKPPIANAVAIPVVSFIVAPLSLAGIGPDRTRLEIWADPALTRNVHRVEVDSDAARFSMSIENIPSDNPRTGRITALSVISYLRKLGAPLRVGS